MKCIFIASPLKSEAPHSSAESISSPDWPIRSSSVKPLSPPYDQIVARVEALVAGENNFLANAANTAAVLYHQLPEVNWAGFYFRHGDELILGPFQGKAACVRIALGRGVCGTAALRQQPIVVPDVHRFPGHIACDPVSRSEIVVPLVWENEVIGVLDVDSPSPGRFTEDDQQGLQTVVSILLSASDMGAASGHLFRK